MVNLNLHTTIYSVTSLFFIVGCGGSSSSNTSIDEPVNTVVIAEGVFIDSPVEGMTYISNDIEGLTDVEGTFEYEVGGEVAFRVGDIVIGSATGAEILSPLSLVDEALDETNPTVVNIATFLQTIDDDGEPENGITITESQHAEAMGLTIDFQLSTFDFEHDVDVQNAVSLLTSVSSAGPRALISADDALAHLQESLGIEVDMSNGEGGDDNEEENVEAGGGLIALSGTDTAIIGTSLDVDWAVYGRDDLTNLDTSIVLTGLGVALGERDTDVSLDFTSVTEGFVIVIGDLSQSLGEIVISMAIMKDSIEYTYVCDLSCNTSINSENQTVTFSNTIVFESSTNTSLTLDGTISWLFEDEVTYSAVNRNEVE